MNTIEIEGKKFYIIAEDHFDELYEILNKGMCLADAWANYAVDQENTKDNLIAAATQARKELHNSLMEFYGWCRHSAIATRTVFPNEKTWFVRSTDSDGNTKDYYV